MSDVRDAHRQYRHLLQKIEQLESQLAKCTRNMQLLETAKREAFSAGYRAGLQRLDRRTAMLENGIIPLDS